MRNTLSVENIYFNYQNKEILKNVKFTCNTTGVVALLGPNGAGKTTLMKILVGLAAPKSGLVKLNEINILEDHKYSIKNVGYLPQNFEIYNNVTGLDFLSYVCDVKDLSKEEKKREIEFLIESFNLKDVINLPFKKYSGGYKRRLGIAQAMIGDPELIIIDEPTVGLDPEQRFEFRQYLSNLGEDRIILISTHIVEDVEFYCKKILMLNNGQLTFDGTPDEFMKAVDNKVYRGEVAMESLNVLKNKIRILEQSRISNELITLKAICEDYVPDKFVKDTPSLENAYVYHQNK